jgi:hypothetical protein
LTTAEARHRARSLRSKFMKTPNATSIP